MDPLNRICPVCSGEMQLFKEEVVTADWTIRYLICQDCELIHSFDHSFFENVLYSDHYFEEVDSGWKKRGDEILAVFDRHFENKKPIKVLDIGSGQNYFVARLLQAGYDAYGIDTHSEPLFATDHFYRNYASLPYDSFDVIVLLEVIEHLISPLQEFEAFAGYLNPSGKLLLTTVVFHKSHPVSASWFINPRFGHVSVWSMRALSIIFSKSGFKNASIYRSGNLQIWDRTPGSFLNRWSIQSRISPVRSLLGRTRFIAKEKFHDLF
jgi:SAM-dependent methyltransferase